MKKECSVYQKTMFVIIIVALTAFLSLKISFVCIPSSDKMADRQIDIITISTVFAGFSFTALGLLVGLSEEKLIIRIRNTDIIPNTITLIIESIVLFIMSVFISIIFLLGIDVFIENVVTAGNPDVIEKMSSLLGWIYIMGVEFLIIGILYFVRSAFQFYDLIFRIHDSKKTVKQKNIDKFKEQLESKGKAFNDSMSEDEYLQ